MRHLLASSAVLWMLLANSAFAGNIEQINNDAEAAINGGDLTVAQKLLVPELKNIANTQTVSPDPQIEKLLANVELWKQSYEKQLKEATEKYIREGQAKYPKQKQDLENETKARDARWQAAKAQGKAYDQFNKEEMARNNSPEKRAEYNKNRLENVKRLETNISQTKEHMELLSAAANARKKIYGTADATAGVYEKSLKQDQSMLEMYNQMHSFSTIEDPKKAMEVALTPKPLDIFKNGFTSPATQITGLKGGGYSWLGHDVWVRFKSSSAVQLKYATEYMPIPLPNDRTDLLKVCPEDRAALMEIANLECKKRSKKSDDRYLITNKKRGLYWYRAWGGS